MAEPAEMQRDNQEVSHEASDVSARGILIFGAVLAFVGVVIHVALYGLLTYYDRREARRWAAVDSYERTEEPPPEPRLQVAPRTDLVEMRRAEDRLLQSYGWIDREKGIVRMPIERGMEIIAERGLPVRKQKPQEQRKTAGSAKARQAPE